METIRLQKYLADRGIASRRACADLIHAGRVSVNGETVLIPGERVSETDTIGLDGTPVAATAEHLRTIALHKPRGYICSASARQGQTVFELIPDISERLVPVGRLDKNSEGLLLMSNDGTLTQRVTHPRHGHEKTYRVTVSGPLPKRTLHRLASRLLIDGHRIQPAHVAYIRKGTKPDRHILDLTLREGRNRQIRKMCDIVGITVHRLVRTRVGTISLARLKPGAWRDLTDTEIRSLMLETKTAPIL